MGALIDDQLVLLENRHPDRAVNWRLSTSDAYRVRDGAEVLFHSHPEGFEWPSEYDQRQAMTKPRSWCIVPFGGNPFWFGDGLPTCWPLLGRPFRYGVTDCYNLIRDGLARFGIQLSYRPRRWGWWLEGDPMYDRGFPEEGFHELPEGTKPQPADVYLFRFRSPVSNHAGLYMGHGQIFHHPSRNRPFDPTWLSRSESLGRLISGRIPFKHLRHESRD